MKRRTGFTLIELLVVIAIIAILAAILFPVFTLVRERARASACISNLKQLGMGFKMYLSDYDKYPGAAPMFRYTSNRPSGEYINLVRVTDRKLPGGYATNIKGGSIYRYVKNEGVYACPSDPQARATRFKCSYSMNAHLDWEYTNAWGYGAMESQVRRPTKTVLLIDEGGGSRSVTAPYTVTPMCDGYFGDWSDYPSDIHMGGCNFLMCDNHVLRLQNTAYKTLIYDPSKG